MKTMNVREARARFSTLIDMAAAGETVVITRRGRESAVLGPVKSQTEKLPSLEAFRNGIAHQDSGLSEEIIAARRQERY